MRADNDKGDEHTARRPIVGRPAAAGQIQTRPHLLRDPPRIRG